MKLGSNYLPRIEKNEASADAKQITMTTTAKGTTINATVTAVFTGEANQINFASVFLYDQYPYDENNKPAEIDSIDSRDVFGEFKILNNDEDITKTATVSFDNLTPEKTYYLVAVGGTKSIFKALINLNTLRFNKLFESTSKTGYTNAIPQETGMKDSQVLIQGSGTASAFNADAALPSCKATDATTWVRGCVVRLIYYIIFVPTSFFFALTGMFLDSTFAYTVDSASYQTQFITQSWGIVRDLCNMFFIFVLLYIAFSTILEIHGFNTKKTIINVIIIGLLINFSLFAVRIMVDASNILARVFYNSDTIKITNVSALNISNMVDKPNENGVISISAAIVNKINPQVLILKANGNEQAGMGGFSTISYVVIVLLASIVNIVGIIVFLSTGLLFVTRVIGLWIAMILSPLAFFTYIIPSWSKQKMIGWENWWPDTLKMAFLAPIFIFFMYIILQFMDTGLGLFDAAEEEGMTLILAIVIPFIFIMILLWQAKKIASDMSGEMGQSITKGVAAVGGLALGGAALGVAGLGRKFIGGTMAKASSGNTATQKYLAAQGDPNAMAKLSKWEQMKGRMGARVGMDKVYGRVGTDANGNKVITGGVGKYVNDKQKHVGNIDHARHEMDETKKAAGLTGVTNLTGEDEKKLESTFAKNKRSEVEANVRRGTDNKKDIALKDNDGNALLDGQGNEIKGEDAWKKEKRSEIETNYINDPNNNIKSVEDLTDKDKKNIENELNKQFNLVLKNTTEKEIKSLFEDIKKEANTKVGSLDRVTATANKRSFDIRNISDVNKTDKRDGFMTKTAAFLASTVALGVRTGFKTSGINIGTSQRDFILDLKNTITEAFKNVKIEVPKASGGGDHGGGGHGGGDHGGGGHH
ncbi:TPA: hypothetical protein DIC38_00825 [Candidatus Nomurabacteria bacterium]|nr:hypothetical protein [Candidatus Nomurabacteria bacterium]